MNTNEYLKLMGYSAEEWTIMNPKTVKGYLDKPGAINNMYPILDRKYVSANGKGNYLVNIKWINKYIEDVGINDPEAEKLKTAAKIIDKIIPSVVPDPPIVSGIDIPLPPKKEIEETVIVNDDFFCEKFNNTAIVCEKQCEECETIVKSKTSLESDKMVQDIGIAEQEVQEHIKEIVEDSGIPKGKVIIASVSKTKSLDKCSDKKLQERVVVAKKKLNMVEVGNVLLNEPTGLKWDINSIEVMTDKEFDKTMATNLTIINTKEKKIDRKPKGLKITTTIKSRIKKLIDLKLINETGVFIFNNIDDYIGKSLLRDEILEMSDENFAKLIISELKTSEVIDEKIKKKEYVPIATEKTVINFEIVDEVINILTAFKKTTYTLAKINEILASEEKDADKIALIFNAVQNV